jgi:hypothetical protein
METDKVIPRHVYGKPFAIRFPGRRKWKKRFQPDRKGGPIWYTDGSKTKKKALELGCIATEHSLGQYTTVFQAEAYAIKAYAVETLGRNSKNRNIYIVSGSQAKLKHLTNTRSPQNWYGIATNPTHNWPDITEFN